MWWRKREYKERKETFPVLHYCIIARERESEKERKNNALYIIKKDADDDDDEDAM